MIGIGITTYNRPRSFQQTAESVALYAPPKSLLFVSDDGSTEDYEQVFAELIDWTVLRGEHANVATSKNRLLRAMMGAGCEHLFLIEDDMVATHERAFRSYVNGSNRWGMHHSMYAFHGNRNFVVDGDHAFTYHYECVGSWCYYNRAAIETVGYMDEAFDNCWEHVVHSMLIAEAGLMARGAGWRRWPDVQRSVDYIGELPVESTHAATDEERLMSSERIQAGLRHWEANYFFPDDIRPLLR